MPRPFRLGLNMPGTVSAGAYTAGVIDFLIDAIDSWYAKREEQIAKYGQDYSKWEIPPHEFELSVMSGASGGGITSALAACALNQPFSPVRKQRAADNGAVNLLFKTWVQDIDITKLLGHRDLDSGSGVLTSLLDSTPIRDIAQAAFKNQNPLPQRRPWVRDGLRLVLSVTNLRGTPYAIEPDSDPDSACVLYFADRQDFVLRWTPGPVENALTLHTDGTGAWDELAAAAVATSAFPVFLAPQLLNRTADEYNTRRWRIDQESPQPGPNGCICQSNDKMPPAWPLTDPNTVFQTLNVDGGATNNNPVDCARLELASLDPPQQNGHNPRQATLADRLLINVAPLAYDVPKRLPDLPKADLLSLLGSFMDAVVAQSRIQGENLKLTCDPEVASRWVISPSTATAGAEPLAGALLGAFGAWVSQLFREHDYQLGRRNCQRFLMAHFGLPWDNVIVKQYGLSDSDAQRFANQYGTQDGGQCPVIPVMHELRSEVTVTRNAIHRSALEPVADMAVDRTKRMIESVFAQNGASLLACLGFKAAWPWLRAPLRSKLLAYAGYGLASAGFVE